MIGVWYMSWPTGCYIILIIQTGKRIHKFSVSEMPGLQRETMTLNDIETSALQPCMTKGRCWILKGSCSVAFKSQGVSKLRIMLLLCSGCITPVPPRVSARFRVKVNFNWSHASVGSPSLSGWRIASCLKIQLSCSSKWHIMASTIRPAYKEVPSDVNFFRFRRVLFHE